MGDNGTFGGTLNTSGLSENALRRKARKAVEDGDLTDRAEAVWRGWLGMNGVTRPASSLIESPEEFVTVAGPSPAGERVSDKEEGYVLPRESYRPLTPPSEEPERLFDAPKPEPKIRRRPLTSVFLRLTSLRPPSSYDVIFETYIGPEGRELAHPHRQLRHYVMTAPKLPKWLVETVMSMPVAAREGTGWPRPEPQVVEAEPGGLWYERLAELENKVAGMETALAAHRDRHNFSLGTAVPQPPSVLTLPLRLTVNAGARIVRAIGAFWRALREE